MYILGALGRCFGSTFGALVGKHCYRGMRIRAWEGSTFYTFLPHISWPLQKQIFRFDKKALFLFEILTVCNFSILFLVEIFCLTSSKQGKIMLAKLSMLLQIVSLSNSLFLFLGFLPSISLCTCSQLTFILRKIF